MTQKAVRPTAAPMRWIDGSVAPNKPGNYWGAFVVVVPVIFVTYWTGEKWTNRMDDGTPFFWGSERLPDAPPLSDIRGAIRAESDARPPAANPNGDNKND